MNAEWSRYAAQLMQVPDLTLFSFEAQQRIRKALGEAESVETISDPEVQAIVEAILVPQVEQNDLR